MAVNVIEVVGSRQVNLGKNPSCRFKYLITGTDDELEARVAMLTVAPIAYEGLFRMSGTVTPIGGGVSEGEVTYELGERVGSSPQDGSNDSNQTQPTDAIPPEADFDISGTTKKITKSLSVLGSIKIATDARTIPDTKGAIGQSDKGVEGVDVEQVHMGWTETWAFPPAAVTWMYIKLLREMYGTVNELPFRTFGEKEVRYMGGSIRANGTDKTKITYKFLTARNPRSDFEDAFPNITGGWTTPAVYPGPWDYVDVIYEADATGKKKLMVPAFVYIHKLFTTDNFLDLGIGR